MGFLVDFFTTNTGEIELKKIVVTVLVAIITAIASIFTSIISTVLNSIRSKKTTYINTVTSNRIKWMQDLKELTDIFIRKTHTNMYSPLYNEIRERIQYFDELSSLRNKIFLHLNYKGYLDDKIMVKINSVFVRIELIYEIDSLLKIKDANDKIKYLIKHYQKDIFYQFLELANISPDNRNDIINSVGIDNEIPKSLTDTINKQINQFNNKFSSAPRKIANEIQDLHNELIMLIQIYLKLEWNRVKDESKSKLKSNNEKKYKKMSDEMIKNYNLKLYDYSLDKLPDYLR